jgi:hemerythrin-like domain-containing protein
MPDVIELIEKDHREVEQLFSEFESSGDVSIATRICDELTKHTKGEEQAVYPVIADRLSSGRDLTDEAIDEHKQARQLIGQIRNTDDHNHRRELITQLKAGVQHHVQEEETEMLPQAREQFTPDELDEMARNFEEAKEAATRS